MNEKKRVLIYSIKNLTDNSKYFISKISHLIDKICFVGYENIKEKQLFSDINAEYYNAVEDALNNNKNFDEYILANDMFYGPFCDLNILFEKMKEYKVWSINNIFFEYKSFIVVKNGSAMENIHFAFEKTFDFDEYIINDNLPFLHKEYFKKSEYEFINLKINNSFEFIKNKTEYNENIIINDLLESKTNRNLINTICFNEVISTQINSLADVSINKKIALIIYLYAEKLIDYCFKYALNIPKESDIYVVTTSEQLLKKIKEKFCGITNKVEYRLKENRGRDNTALLITCKDLFVKYDYICFIHSKESKQNKISGYIFRNHCFESLLYNNIYVNNIINKFEKNPRLGLIIPFPPEFEPYRTIGNEWLSNYENAVEFLKKRSKQNIQLDKKNIICAFGGMFWFRPQAFKTLLSLNIQTKDFPEEPLSKNDGLLTHVIERIIPALSLYDKFFTAYVIPDVKAALYINTLISSLKNEKNKNI